MPEEAPPPAPLWYEPYQFLAEPPYLYYVLGAALGLLILWWIWSFRRRHRHIVPFRTEGGRIEIAPKTLRNIIRKATEAVDGVEHSRCTYRQRGKKLHVQVSVTLLANSRLEEVQNEIRRRIRSTLKSQFGMENVEPIDIRVTKLVGVPLLTQDFEEPAVYSRPGSSPLAPTRQPKGAASQRSEAVDSPVEPPVDDPKKP